MEAFADRAKSRAQNVAQSERRRRTRAETATLEMHRFAELGDWTGAQGIHLAALYGWCHRQTYGVEDAEVVIGDLTPIAQAADRMVKQLGGPNEVVDYMRWCWNRERRAIEWRRQSGRESRRLGWRLLFGPCLLTDYRAAVAGAPKAAHASG